MASITTRVKQFRGMEYLAALCGVGLTLAAGGVASAQDTPPPRPAPRVISVFPVSAVPARYDMVVEVLDFAPGAATPEFAYLGPTFVTVLEGGLTLQSGDAETVYSAGGEEDDFSRPSGSLFNLHNAGGDTARALISVLLPPGSPLLSVRPNTAPANGATIVHAARRPTPMQPGDFRVAQGIFEIPSGGDSNVHCHLGGGGIVIGLTGEQVHMLGGTTVTQGPGDVIEDIANRPARHLNRGLTPATVATSYLIPGSGPAAADALPAGGCPAA
jgi:quercetin dioxygenase-like cupin family protein